MARGMLLMNGVGHSLAASLGGLVLLGLSGCAGEQAKPSVPPGTPDHVRSHAEKAFESLKQEEQH